MEKVAGEHGGQPHEDEGEKDERDQPGKEPVLEIRPGAEFEVAFLGDKSGQDKKEHHVEGIDELVQHGGGGIVQHHDPLDEMAEKDHGHGVESGDVDVLDSMACYHYFKYFSFQSSSLDNASNSEI